MNWPHSWIRKRFTYPLTSAEWFCIICAAASAVKHIIKFLVSRHRCSLSLSPPSFPGLARGHAASHWRPVSVVGKCFCFNVSLCLSHTHRPAPLLVLQQTLRLRLSAI